MSFIALCAFCIIEFNDLKPKDWTVAIIFGLIVFLPMLINASSANISLSVATFYTYLASVTMKNQYGNRMPFIKSTKFINIAVDLSIMGAIILVWLSTNNWSIAEFVFSINNVVLRPLSAAIGEEVFVI